MKGLLAAVSKVSLFCLLGRTWYAAQAMQAMSCALQSLLTVCCDDTKVK
jgi:hypothetical protein